MLFQNSFTQLTSYKFKLFSSQAKKDFCSVTPQTVKIFLLYNLVLAANQLQTIFISKILGLLVNLQFHFSDEIVIPKTKTTASSLNLIKTLHIRTQKFDICTGTTIVKMRRNFILLVFFCLSFTHLLPVVKAVYVICKKHNKTQYHRQI